MTKHSKNRSSLRIVRAIPVLCNSTQKNRHSMAWNQHQHRDRRARESHHVAGTHFETCARSRMAKQTAFVRGDTSSSWTFLPKQVVGVAPFATGGASAARPISGLWEREQDENERMPNKPMQAPEQIAERCSSGAPSRHSTKENCSVFNTG